MAIKIACDCGNEANISLSRYGYIAFNGIVNRESNCPFDILTGRNGQISIRCNNCYAFINER